MEGEEKKRREITTTGSPLLLPSSIPDLEGERRGRRTVVVKGFRALDVCN